MKIALLSINMYAKGLNFACPIHSYAFQQFLLKNGIESTVLNYKANYYGNFNPRYPGKYYSKLCEQQYKALMKATEEERPLLQEEYDRRKRLADGYTALEKEREIRYEKFEDFINKYYIKTDEVYNSDLLEVKDPGFDCYMCVTDVVWKYEKGAGFDRGYFLGSGAMENKWKIAYSASRGVPKPYTDEQQRFFLHYLEDFDIISVRENSLKKFIEENSDLSAKVVMDPVLLNDKEVYEKISVKPEEEHYLLLYYAEERSPNSVRQAIKYAKEHNLKIVETTNLPIKDGILGEREDVDSVFRYDIGPDEWLGYIQHADCVVTNSFHATCFCLIFEKEFYVGSRHGDKITNLLETFGLLDRKLSEKITEEDDRPAISLPDIDYVTVKQIIEEKCRDSKEFILSAIRFAENNERPIRDYEWWKRSIRYCLFSNSGKHKNIKKGTYDPEKGEIKKLRNGSWEFQNNQPVANDGLSRFGKNLFSRKGFTPDGWRLRFRIDNEWFWYLEDGSYVLLSEYNSEEHPPIRKFKDGERIPYIPVTEISLAIAEAFWKKGYVDNIALIYNGGLKNKALTCHFDEEKGELKRLSSGSQEYRMNERFANTGKTKLIKNEFECPGYDFLGWKMRIRYDGEWYWYLEDRTLKPTSQYVTEKDGERYLLQDDTNIPYIPSSYIDTVVLEGVWKKQIAVIYNGGLKAKDLTCHFDEEKGELKRLSSGSLEYRTNEKFTNDGQTKLIENKFEYPGYDFLGWKMRIKEGGQWCWYLEDGTLNPISQYNAKNDGERYLLQDGTNIPYIPADRIDTVVLEGVWKKQIAVIYNGGLKFEALTCHYDKEKGKIKRLETGSLEYKSNEKFINNGQTKLIENAFECPGYDFLGWRMRIKDSGKWYWYLEDGSLKATSQYNEEKDKARYLLKDGATVPYIPANNVDTVVLEGVWENNIILIYNGGLKAKDLTCRYDEKNGEIKRLETGSLEYRMNEKFTNNGQAKLIENAFKCPGYEFLGWRMRIKDGRKWYWYLESGKFRLASQYKAENDGERYLLQDGANIPYIQFNHVDKVVLEGVWKVKFKTKLGRRIYKIIDR